MGLGCYASLIKAKHVNHRDRGVCSVAGYDGGFDLMLQPQNLRVVGLPEDMEGRNPRQFMVDLFKELAGEALTGTVSEIDRAHHSLRPKSRQGSRPVIVSLPPFH